MQAKPQDQSESVFINANQVRARYGGVSHMTLLRWMDAEGFPAATYFGRKRFWKLEQLESWERERAARSSQRRPVTGFARGVA